MTATTEPPTATSNGLSPEPEVELLRWFARPHDASVAAARTCYSSKVIYPDDVSATEAAQVRRDAIAKSIYQAGHHTTIQHPTFLFVLKKVSRQLIWSFLHAHPFYNSEQVSQRYVKVKKGRYLTPALAGEALAVYHDAAAGQMQAYRDLTELLRPETSRRFFSIYPGRRNSADAWKKSIEKRVLEVARYALPIATHAHLYHTISGVTLYRYWKLQGMFDVPAEQRFVVQKMVEAVRREDPGFLQNLDDPIALEDTPEYRLMADVHGRSDGLGDAAAFIREFDDELDGRLARLVDWKVNAEATLARSVRSMFGLSRAQLTDAEAIDRVLDPQQNALLGSALNVTTLSKLTRAMVHVHYTFQKKLSHTADSQAQRHRMTPGSRPVLSAHYVPGSPDYVTPPLIEAVPEARERYARAMVETWEAIDRLLELGVPTASALYLLPNAFPIRFEESGDLLNQRHKWTLRLCYLAQEEIFEASKDEVQQVAAIHPQIAKWMLAPCGLRKRAGKKPFCPEGARFCGSPVWNLPVAEYERQL